MKAHHYFVLNCIVLFGSSQFALAQQSNCALTNGLVAWWRAESNAVDRVSGAPGTVHGGSFTGGRVGTAFSFDGIDDYVDTGTSLDVGGDMTVAAWIKTGPGDVQKFIAANRSRAGAEDGWELYLTADGRCGFQVANRGGTEGLSNLRDGLWHHVVGSAVTQK